MIVCQVWFFFFFGQLTNCSFHPQLCLQRFVVTKNSHYPQIWTHSLLHILPHILGFHTKPLTIIAIQTSCRSPEYMSQKMLILISHQKAKLRKNWVTQLWKSGSSKSKGQIKVRNMQQTVMTKCLCGFWIINRSQACVQVNICMKLYLQTFSNVNCNLPCKNKHTGSQTCYLNLFIFFFLHSVYFKIVSSYLSGFLVSYYLKHHHVHRFNHQTAFQVVWRNLECCSNNNPTQKHWVM